MEIESSAAMAGISFFIGVTATMVGAAWRLRTTIEREIRDVFKQHLETEHARDAQGRTLRERMALIEASLLSLQSSISEVRRAQ